MPLKQQGGKVAKGEPKTAAVLPLAWSLSQQVNGPVLVPDSQQGSDAAGVSSPSYLAGSCNEALACTSAHLSAGGVLQTWDLPSTHLAEQASF